MFKDLTLATGNLFMFIVMLTMFPILVVLLGLFDGWVLSKLWNWFVVPIFGLKVLTVLEAWGLGLLIGIVKYSSSDKPPKGGQELSIAFGSKIATFLLILLIGYCLKSYMGL